MLEPHTSMHGFTVQSEEPLNEIDGKAYVMRHDASGARLLYLANKDENKAFSITFKTPPKDDTGVFHILEHSVLCGSDKFPVKEPFVNLLKTSMQTFLNALTYPDKTMYPVASTNQKDLMNLMDVYLDAVLNPAIYHDKAIFEQEGWHLELDEGGNDRKLRYNGVVFNEMKGALSDPEGVLYRAMNKALFPDTCYAYESGGDPRAIPTLTYESYLDTHARHYRLDNAYIVLYGDMDIDAMLAYLDERYLAVTKPRVDAAPNPMGTQAPLISLDNVVRMDTTPENACVGLGYVIGGAHDFERLLACDVLMDALMGGNESPIKRAVLDADLGGDTTAYLMDSQAQPAALFLLRNAKPGSAKKFMEVVEREATRLVREGIPRDLLEASIAQMAFDLRERDRGIADGVALAMNAMAGWLYNDDDATLCLHYEEALAHLRAGLSTRYFEDVLESLMLTTDHKALVDLQASSDEGESEEAAELAQKLAGMSESDLQGVRDEVAALRKRQETPDTPEGLATLPKLHVSDIGPAKPDVPVQVIEDTPLPLLYHDVPTRNIDYVYWYFDLGSMDWEDLPYVSLLTTLLGSLGTEHHTAAELDVWSRSHLGALRFFIDSYAQAGNPDALSAKMVVSAAATTEERDQLGVIPREVWAETRFDDAARIKALLVQRRIGMEQSFVNEGHTCATNRLAASLFRTGRLNQQLSGVDFYLFLKDLIDHFDERFDALSARLAAVRDRVFCSDACQVSFTGTPEDRDALVASAGDFGLKPAREYGKLVIPAPQMRREAFVVPTDVCYVARGADVHELGEYSGVWQVVSNALSFDYLWNEVRVKGGAYGVGFRRTPIGFARFSSYRDPHIDSTVQRFDAAAKWVESFDPAPDEMEGYIVSTVAAHDAPAKPRLIARRQDAQYFSGRPADWREKLRAQELACTPEQLRATAPVLQAVSDSPALCVFGNEDIVNASSTKFDRVVKLMEA